MTAEQIVGLVASVGTLIVILVGVLDWLIRKGLKDQTTRQLDRVTRQNHQLTQDNQSLNQKLTSALTAHNQAQTALQTAQHDLTQAQSLVSQHTCDLQITGTQLQHAQDDLLKLRQRQTRADGLLRKALKLEGELWTGKVMRGAARFRPLAERNMPIISVLNLKGGVGKTTLAAYLAWGLAERGYRILLVDLDLQGSLSSLFLSEQTIKERLSKRLLLQDFFQQAARDRKTRLTKYAVPTAVDRVSVVPASDRLAYAEMSMAFRWLLRLEHPGKSWSGSRDVRFLVRRALHLKSLRKHYDVVLLDCPPLLNFSCVNALAASDYVIIPATCSRKATERIPPMLDRIGKLREAINKDLAVIGMVANKTHWDDRMSSEEQDLWNATANHAQNICGQPIHRFQQLIPDRVDFRDAESSFSPPQRGDVLFRVFSRLVRELEGRLPDGCRRPAKVSS